MFFLSCNDKYFHSVKDEMFHSTRLRLVEWNISSFTRSCECVEPIHITHNARAVCKPCMLSPQFPAVATK